MMEYKGEKVNNVPYGYGKLYEIVDEDTKTLIYEGFWKRGKYHFKGILYNRKGEVVYRGEFANGAYHGIGEKTVFRFNRPNSKLNGTFRRGVEHGSIVEYDLKEKDVLSRSTWRNGRILKRTVCA